MPLWLCGFSLRLLSTYPPPALWTSLVNLVDRSSAPAWSHPFSFSTIFIGGKTHPQLLSSICRRAWFGIFCVACQLDPASRSTWGQAPGILALRGRGPATQPPGCCSPETWERQGWCAGAGAGARHSGWWEPSESLFVCLMCSLCMCLNMHICHGMCGG